MAALIKKMTVQSALHKLKRKIPYGWDLNVYRGCGHGCRYCYAYDSHDYLKKDNFYSDIYVKENLLELLERELSAPGWKREVINIGGVTDSYQPAEAECKMMPEILKLLIKYKTPAIISTKSDLVLRDIDLIDELSRITYINIAETITTKDENVRRIIEPGAAKSEDRFAVLRAFRQTNACTGLHVMPIIPFLTDNRENMEWLVQNAAEAKVDYLLPGTLYLRGATRSIFFDCIKRNFPERLDALNTLYRTGGAGKAYKDPLYRMVNELRTKYSVTGGYMKPMKERLSGVTRQIAMFEEG